MRRLLGKVFVIGILLSGCASNSQVFSTREGGITQCSNAGVGLVGVSLAAQSFDACVRNNKVVGNLEIERTGALGFTFGDATSIPKLRILKLVANSPTKAAGILPGDILVAVTGQAVNNQMEAMALLYGEEGTSVDFEIKRGEEIKKYNLVRMAYTKLYGNL